MKRAWWMWSVALAIVLVSWTGPVDALPIYSVTASSSCDTCHIEPLGWANPDMSDRRCTVDCVGCHVSSAGGGMRLADGLFYGKEVLPIWGTRPSSFADPEQYRPRGFPKKGGYSLGEGFSGWWPGKIPHTEIEERYGNIKPHPKWRIGGDFRAALLSQSFRAAEGQTSFFPMQADLYLLNESVRDLWLYVSGGLQGYRDTGVYGADTTEAEDYFTIRELFMKYRLPRYNAWARVGRFIPRYGWRTSDHTAFSRVDLGFDQFFQAFGADVGINPNYFYADLSGYFQGLAAWPGERMPRGVGSTLNVGWRDLGWQVGASAHYASLFGTSMASEGESSGPKLLTAGLNWALNLNPVGYYGEMNLRQTRPPGDQEPSNGLVAFHRVVWNMTQGVYGRFQYDWSDANIRYVEDHKHRVTVGFDVHPYTYVHLEALYRLNYGAESPFARLFDSSVNEFLLITHVWF